MALRDFISKQFIDVIEWTEEPGELAERFDFADNEIQNGAQLTVRETQAAVVVDEGVLADMYGPGLHTLETSNMPILTNLKNWDKAFESPFKTDVYFFSQKEQLNLKWGTAQPVTIRDAELGPVRLRAFGTYSFRVKEIAPFYASLVGTLEKVMVKDIEPQLRAAIMTALATGLGSGGIPFLDLAANQQKLSEALKDAVDPAFAQYGLEVPSFFVESVSLPEEVQKHLDKSSSMRVIGDLDKYAKFQAAEAIEKAAEQEGGMAGIGAGAGAGVAIGHAMAGAFAQPQQAAQPAQPAGGGGSDVDPFERIEKLHKLHEAGALSKEEFEAKKAELLKQV
ncbi:MAG: SPFH domain-containing protein [Parasphingopyxis sp.]|nr:SPFH domain-containing protein [Sphingomonadales bacterium]